jgi:transposase
VRWPRPGDRGRRRASDGDPATPPDPTIRLDECFTFLSHPEVEPTNWEVERAIRPAVVNRKVWGGNRTWAGARAQEVLMSVLETCRRAGRPGLEFVSQTLRGFANPRLPRPILLTPR